MALISVFVLSFGLVVGSFLNVLIYRLPRNLNFVKGRSFCPKCKTKIHWSDNIPLLSFLMLRGKCRACKSPISPRYPLVEIVTGVLTVLIFNFQFTIFNQLLNFQIIFSFICYLLLTWGLIVIFLIDLENQIIPDEILLPLIGLFLIKTAFPPLNSKFLILNSMTSAVGAFLFLFIIYLVTKGRGMGFGDVKLAFLMGLSLGFPKIIVAFYIAFLTGAFAGIILILGSKAKLKQKIAFGPFLSFATLTTILWGEKILGFVLALL